MAILSKTQILEAKDALIKTVPVPAWGGDVCIRRLSGTARDQWELWCRDHADKDGRLKADSKNVRATLVALALCDENGDSLGFTPQEIERLGGKDGEVLDSIYSEVHAHSALGAKAKDDLVKNSESDQSGGSGTA